MSLKEIEKEAVIKLRLEKANDTLAEIPVLIENKFYRTAANRLYYACSMSQPRYLSMTVMKPTHIAE
jgi:hypothetical protein